MVHDTDNFVTVDGVQPLAGPQVWGTKDAWACSLEFRVDVLCRELVSSKLRRRHGGLDRIGAAWLTHADVHSAYEEAVHAHMPLVWLPTGEFFVELPDLQGVPTELRTSVLLACREVVFRLLPDSWPTGVFELGVQERQRHWQFLRTLQSVTQGGVANRWGTFFEAPSEQRMFVDRVLGDAELPWLPPYCDDVWSIKCQMVARTAVGAPVHAGLVWLQPAVPADAASLLTFNQQIARFPQRLFSFEVCRVATTLRALAVLDALLVRDWEVLQSINTVYDETTDGRILCIDQVLDCFRPLEPLWERSL